MGNIVTFLAAASKATNRGGWVSTVIEIGALVVTIFGIMLFYRFRKEKKPQVRMRSFNLVSRSITEVKPDKIKVTYSGEEVENLTVTNVAFWNAGKEPIRAGDVASKEPTCITIADGYRILEAEVVQTNNPSSNITCELSGDNEVKVDFEYLEKGNGAVIRVFHTGQTDDDLAFKGKIIGAKVGVEKKSFLLKLMSNPLFHLGWLIAFLVCLMFHSNLSTRSQNGIGMLYFAPITIYIIITFYDNILKGRNEVPRSLDLFSKYDDSTQRNGSGMST